MRTIRTIDAHVAGAPVRLIVDGFPSPRGRTMLEKQEWLARHSDRWRRTLMLEPRGHRDMAGALLTEPVSPGAHAGVLFMHHDGYGALSGHAVIGVTTIALERGLIVSGDGRTLVFDTPAGTIRAHAEFRAGRAGGAGRAEQAGRVEKVLRVAYENVPSFVLQGGLPIAVGNRKVRVDVAFGGSFYAIVDSEAVGLPLDAGHLPDLRRAGVTISRAVEAAATIVHPLQSGLRGIAGTVFTAPPREDGTALRNATILADGKADRSPGGTATAAVMAVVDAMGLIGDEASFVHESFIGTRLTGRIIGRTAVGEYDAIVPQIEGAAWITGEHAFQIDDHDPFGSGFRV